MYRIPILVLLASVAFAQQDAPPAFKAPPEAEQALRARVTSFYTLLKEHDYRKAEAWVSEDTKDYYYDGQKPDIRQFELLNVQFSDATHAIANVQCTQPVMVPGFPLRLVSANVPTRWRFENGDWFVYEEVAKMGSVHTAKTLEELVATMPKLEEPKVPADFPTDQSFIIGRLHMDKNEVELKPGASAKVRIFNSAIGPYVLRAVVPPKGIDASVDSTTMASGQIATVTLKAGPHPTSGYCEMVVMPSGEIVRIKVTAK